MLAVLRQTWRFAPANGAHGQEAGHAPSECLAKPDIDRHARLAVPPADGRADVDPDRAEAGVIANADTGSEAKILELRQGRGVDIAGIDERHDAEVADPNPGFEREFSKATATDRILEDRIARSQVLITKAANRAAAAGVEATGRRNAVAARADDRAEPGAAGDDDFRADRLVVSGVDLSRPERRKPVVGSSRSLDPS
jgi:hypothetical protein